MSRLTPKDPRRLLTTARRQPTELSRTEIRSIVRNFPTGGPAPPDPTPLPTVLTVAGLVATASLLIGYAGSWWAPPILSDATEPTTKIESTPANLADDVPGATIERRGPLPPDTASAPPAVNVEPGNLPRTISRARIPVSAKPPPSAAPQWISEGPPNTLSAVAPLPRAESHPTDPTLSISGTDQAEINKNANLDGPWADGGAFDPVTLTGTWERSGNTIKLNYGNSDGTNPGRTLRPKLTSEEFTTAIPAGEEFGHIERETGRLLLALEGKIFVFQARKAVRERFEKKGWIEPAIEGGDGSNWFQYFAHNVGGAYLTTLRQLGLDRKELPNLGELIEAEVDLHDLRALANQLNGLDFEPNRSKTDLLLDFHRNGPLLSALEQNDYSLQLDTWREIRGANMSSFYLEGVNAGRSDPYELNDVIAMHAAGVSDHAVKDYTAAFGRDLTAGEIIAVHEGGVPPAAARDMLADRYVGATVKQLIRAYVPPRATLSEIDIDLGIGEQRGLVIRKGGSSRTVPFEGANKLIVMNGFHVTVVAGDSNYVVIHAEPDVVTDVRVEVSRRGELQIYGAIPFAGRLLERSRVNIRVVTTGLRKVHARTNAHIIVDPAVGVKSWTVYGKGEVQVEPVKDDPAPDEAKTERGRE